jgi:hypothetical protein
MSEFPKSALEIRLTAERLVKFLRENIQDTHGRQEWSYRNFSLLRKFTAEYGAANFPSDEEKEFLWDFVAYIGGKGLLLVAESEWNSAPSEVEQDFEKLLYVRSPLKLMLCRMRTEEDAEGLRSRLSHFAASTCCEYSPAEVFVLYCVWWAGNAERNRDCVYSLQIGGEPSHVPMGSEGFQRVAL